MTTREHDFEQLLRGHATLSLTAAEQGELRALAAADAECGEQVAAFTAVHQAFADERALYAAVAAPAQAVEESDESFARLAAAGARAENDLRSRLLHAPAPMRLRARQRPVRIVLKVAAALAAAALVAFALGVFDGPPALHQGVPRPEVAGGVAHTIVIAPHVSAADRTLSWSPLWHAASYDVVIVDAGGKVVLQRAADLARSTRWELTTQEFEQLRARPELRLRVRALDGMGLPVGTSGDLPLAVH